MKRNTKSNPPKNSENGKQTHNPADEGVDHNIQQNTEKSLDDTYIDKQEARGTRGEDNEDTTDEGPEIKSDES